MIYSENTYVSTNDLLFQGVLNDIRKSKVALQPIFEAFTNSLEAISIRFGQRECNKGKIEISIYCTQTTTEQPEFSSLSITDNGIGFDEKEFKRFNTFKDFTKGFKNLGSGRIQFSHFFDNTVVKSVFEKDNKIYEREFIVSKKESFLKRNAIVFHHYCNQIETEEIKTTITFNTLLENSNIYNNLTDKILKDALLERYIHYFCYNKENLPILTIKYFIQMELQSESRIIKSDIPSIDNSKEVDISYTRHSDSGRSIEKTDKTELFRVDAFKITMDALKENKIKLVSKGEVIDDSEIPLQGISGDENIKGYKYLFLVSSDYIDERDTNIRGQLNIPTKESFTKNTSLFTSEEIVFEDITEVVNRTIESMYPEIDLAKKKHIDQFDALKKMFLLDDDSAHEIKLSINDTEAKILEKFYEVEAKKMASVDASIKESIDRLDALDTTDEGYTEKLKKEIEKLVKEIPLQNKTSLTHYVARRKLILELFQKILDNKLDVQKTSERNFDEALIHNLLFQQSGTNPEDSDLWLLNEDFIYFKGSSEKQLSLLEIDGTRVFKKKFTDEEEAYLLSGGENRKIKRPDVLLFPEEGKCIIIEFKDPKVNASEHLTQIDFYANLIRNYTIDDIQITTFYGYLIGENIEPRDVLGRVSRFEHSYQFDYLYKPSENVIGFDGRTNGSIYTEVLKYSTLLERAKRRNRIFLQKLKMSL